VNIRPYHPRDLKDLTELTIATFGPFYENHFRPLVGETIFRHRRGHIGAALCEYAFADMTTKDVEVVTVGTGGTDSFHAPARALYESMGCVPVHVAVYFKQL